MNKKEAVKEWLINHKLSLQSLSDKNLNNLIERCDFLIKKIENPNDKSNIGEEFSDIFNDVVEALSENGKFEEIHTLDNIALLSANDNSSLNNSTFDVKRNKIIEMDKTIDYIPVCTRRVFLKYYTNSDKNNLHFWGEADRKAYIENMNDVLKVYFSINKKEIDL